jgi:hypothetical protein
MPGGVERLRECEGEEKRGRETEGSWEVESAYIQTMVEFPQTGRSGEASTVPHLLHGRRKQVC